MKFPGGRWRLAVVCIVLMPLAVAQAEVGWAYRYKWVDVTVEGQSQEAVKLAHDLTRLDAAMVKVLKMDLGESRPPVHVYAMPQSQLQKLLGIRKIDSRYAPHGFESDVLINTDSTLTNRYHGAYYGYSASVLLTEGALRYPVWFRLGMAEIFAASSMERKAVKIGGYLPWHAETLLTGTLLPMRRLLRLQPTDAEIQVTSTYRQMVDSECWFLAHLIIIEGKLHNEFAQYLQLMNRGQTETDAFAASFPGMSYEDLDKVLKEALSRKKIHEVLVAIPEEFDAQKPDKLGAAELKGRLARLGMLESQDLDYPLKLAHEALTAEPTNESALRALAQGQIRQNRYTEALETMRTLCGRSTLSAPAYADCAQIALSVAKVVKQSAAAVGAGPAGLAQQTPEDLSRQAHEDYEHAIALDQENLGYWAQLAELIGQQRDAGAAKALKPRVEQVFYLHPRNAALAWALARMYSATGDLDDAFKFALAWQNNAMTEQARDAAAAYISQVKVDLERRDAAARAAGPAKTGAH